MRSPLQTSLAQINTACYQEDTSAFLVSSHVLAFCSFRSPWNYGLRSGEHTIHMGSAFTLSSTQSGCLNGQSILRYPAAVHTHPFRHCPWIPFGYCTRYPPSTSQVSLCVDSPDGALALACRPSSLSSPLARFHLRFLAVQYLLANTG